MKKLVLMAAVAALAACSPQAEDDAATTETAEAEAEATTAAATGTHPGTYEVTMADGTKGTTVINADGTYVDTDAKGVQTRGKFVARDGKDCFDPDGDAPEECWTVGTAGADGSFTATGADGKTTVTVRPSTGSTTVTTTASPTPAAT